MKVLVVATPYVMYLYMMINRDWKKTYFVISQDIEKDMVSRLNKMGVCTYYDDMCKDCKLERQTGLLMRVYHRLGLLLKNIKLRFLSYKFRLQNAEIYGQDHLAEAKFFLKSGFRVIEDGLASYGKKEDFDKDGRLVRLGGEIYFSGGFDYRVKTVYFTGRVPLQNELKNKAVFLDMKQIWAMRTTEEKKDILMVLGFNLKKLERLIESGRRVFLLTQNWSDAGMLSVERQIQIYDEILRNYDKNEVIIKVHPYEKVDYEKYFPECIVLKDPFPFELCYFMNLPIKKIVTISSTAVYGLWTSQYVDIYDEYMSEICLK